jgi:hypothetical protein
MGRNAIFDNVFGGLIRSASKQLKLAVVFEVTDDPSDLSDPRSILKPIDVWLRVVTAPVKMKAPAVDELVSDPKKRWDYLGRITRDTPIDLRTYGFLTKDSGGFLYVLALPAPEWSGRYGPRFYDQGVPVKQGQVINVSVSVPLLTQPSPTNS